MLDELKNAYSKISLEDKRNELNKEVLTLLMLTGFQGNLFNYVKNSGISEDEYLTETYIQLFELRKRIMSVTRKNI